MQTNLHLKSFFDQFDIKYSDTGFHRLKNPLDNTRNRNMVVNFETNFVHDWKLGYTKSIAGFVSDVTGMQYYEAVEFVGIIDVPLSTKVATFRDEVISDVILPETLPLDDISITGQRVRDYLVNKARLDPYKLMMKGWTYSMEGKWMGRIIIPFKIKGKLSYYIGRTFIDGSPKYLNPTTTEVSIGKSELFYNQDALYKYDEICLVEGVTDAETIGDNAIASLGWALSPTQISLITKSRCKILNIIPDQGFKNKAIATGLYFKHIMDVYIHDIPKEYKDINQCGLEKLIINKNRL